LLLFDFLIITLLFVYFWQRRFYKERTNH